jgi:hypothetical protein
MKLKKSIAKKMNNGNVKNAGGKSKKRWVW